jgi:hypothetical protein
MKKAIIVLAVAILAWLAIASITKDSLQTPGPATTTPATTTTPVATTTPQVPADIQAHIDEHADMIVLESPEPYESVTSPLVLTGKARGGWYFEASFPITIVNWDGLIIAEGYAEAQGDWMTSEFVPFKATINFTKPSFDERGTIILKKDNPSGLPENDDALEIPIRFQ